MQDDVLLYETDFWKVILIPNQAYLGRCIISLNRDCGEMSELTSEEWTDFHENIVQNLEFAFREEFNATMFNWTCLMNNAFKSHNPEPHVHWHFRPRYRENITVGGKTFRDSEFAHHYTKERTRVVSKDVLEKIARKVKKVFR